MVFRSKSHIWVPWVMMRVGENEHTCLINNNKWWLAILILRSHGCFWTMTYIEHSQAGYKWSLTAQSVNFARLHVIMLCDFCSETSRHYNQILQSEPREDPHTEPHTLACSGDDSRVAGKFYTTERDRNLWDREGGGACPTFSLLPLNLAPFRLPHTNPSAKGLLI